MEIQSLSVCVPAPVCFNACKFCVSRMHKDNYVNRLDMMGNMSDYDLHVQDYIKRMEYARDNGCNTVMLTGQVEPQQNLSFLEKFAKMNAQLRSPFKNIEIQTTGATINKEMLSFFRRVVGITTISLSVSCLIDDEVNNEVIGRTSWKINLEELCRNIKEYGFNLRLSLNVTDQLMKDKYPKHADILARCKELGADQVTFRQMFVERGTIDAPQTKWVLDHRLVNPDFKPGIQWTEDQWFTALKTYVKNAGTFLNVLEYGDSRYSVDEMSVVIDTDCMAKDETKKSYKYLILRPDCRLYSKWDDKGSLIF